jgi:penicillin-binding protein 1C
MRCVRRVILGSGRLPRAWFRRLAGTNFFSRRIPEKTTRQEKYASAGRARQARGTRALPRAALSRIVVLSSVSLLILVLVIWWLPLPNELDRPALGTLTLLDCRGREIAELASPQARVQLPRRLDEMGKWLPLVTIALEDHRFYKHSGLDWCATAAAFTRNLKSGHILSGGSTITQQVVKIASGRQRRSWSSKIYETICAWKLERRWSKEQILAEYLNRSSYGNRRLGPEAAARAYFGKSARDLTLSESIFLAGLPQAPTRFNPWKHPERAAKRYDRSVARLAQLNAITQQQRLLLEKSAPIAGRFGPPHLAPHFVDAVVAQNPKLRGTIRTSLDLDLQRPAEQLLRSHLAVLNRYDITEAAMVIVESETGAVRAMVGSSDYAKNQINGAMRARSCGSTLKPFVYLSAIDRRLLTAASLLPDTADAIRGEYADYDPQNFNHRYLGPVRLREALGCSLNVPAVFTLSQLGARPTFYELRKWGFEFSRHLSDYGAGFILGNAEIRLVDLAGAYAGLARNGIAMRAKLLAAEHHPMTRLASQEATEIISDILCDNGAREKSFGTHSPLAFNERVSVKTGTSSGFRDAWTVGFDKEHTVAVWVGNFDGRPMRDTFAVRSATPLWAVMMHELLRHDHPLDRPGENERLLQCDVCAETGFLPSSQTVAKVKEFFLSGTEPQQSSAGWFSEDGKLLLPNEYANWCASGDNTRNAQVRPEPRITSPVANARYEIDPVLPQSQQMIELTTTLGNNARWFVNGARQLPQADGRFFWQLAPGEWKLRAVSSGGSAEETIFVE